MHKGQTKAPGTQLEESMTLSKSQSADSVFKQNHLHSLTHQMLFGISPPDHLFIYLLTVPQEWQPSVGTKPLLTSQPSNYWDKVFGIKLLVVVGCLLLTVYLLNQLLYSQLSTRFS